MQWSDLLAAIALLLVLEGVLPFLKPSAMRGISRKLEALSDQQLRVAGFISMLAGIVLLSIVR